MEQETSAPTRYLSPKRICDKLSRGITWFYEVVRTDPTFPSGIPLGDGRVWAENEIEVWLHEQAKRHVETPRKPGRPKGSLNKSALESPS